MAWRTPETFGSLPPAAWPVEVGVYVLAMTPQDIAQVVVLVIGGTGGAAAILGRFLWSKWEASNARELAKVRAAFADCKIECDEVKAERDAEKEDRNRVRKQKDAELDRRQEIIDNLRRELEAAYKTVAERDESNRVLLVAIDNLNQSNHMLGKDLEGVARAGLIDRGILRAKNP